MINNYQQQFWPPHGPGAPPAIVAEVFPTPAPFAPVPVRPGDRQGHRGRHYPGDQYPLGRSDDSGIGQFGIKLLRCCCVCMGAAHFRCNVPCVSLCVCIPASFGKAALISHGGKKPSWDNKNCSDPFEWPTAVLKDGQLLTGCLVTGS